MMFQIFRTFGVEVLKSNLKISFTKSSGPGGQHVNKTSSKADVRFLIDTAHWMTPEVRHRLKTLYAHYINKEGELVVQSQKYRDQTSNEQDAIEKIQKMVDKASEIPKDRSYEEYRESEEKKVHRINMKRQISERKSNKKERFDLPGRFDN